MTVRYEMTNLGTDELAATLESTSVLFDLEKRVRWPSARRNAPLPSAPAGLSTAAQERYKLTADSAPAGLAGVDPHSMSIIVTKGTLDWAYPPFILATTAAAMGLNVSMFFTFYGLPLLLKDLDLKISSLGNPAMKMPMIGGHMGLPNAASMLPGMDAAASRMMKNLMAKKGVASIQELRAPGAGGGGAHDRLPDDHGPVRVRLEDMIEGPELGGAATYIEAATDSHINLFI